MEKGSIDYAPDYKSDRAPLRQVLDILWCNPIAAERTRLEHAVVSKAMAWKQNDDGDNKKWSVHYVEMCEAIDALIQFESSQP